MNNYEELGRVTTELALLKRAIFNGINEIHRRVGGGALAVLAAESHARNNTDLGKMEARLDELKRNKTKLLNKCKKEFKEQIL